MNIVFQFETLKVMGLGRGTSKGGQPTDGSEDSPEKKNQKKYPKREACSSFFLMLEGPFVWLGSFVVFGVASGSQKAS